MASNKVIIISVIILAVLILIVGFSFFGNKTKIQANDSSDNLPPGGQASTTSEIWMNFPLSNVRTGETFKISDFRDKPVLLESFAVWCPTCTKQQNEIKKLHDELGDSIVSISLDTDPNEDESRILQHIQSNGFDWYYAVSPSDLTLALIDEFGVSIINAPSAPVVLICEDGSFRKLGSGVKKVQELKEAIASCGG